MPGIFELYRLKNTDDPVSLTVTIGQASKGETTLYIDSVKQNGTFHDSFCHDVGPNNCLNLKQLEVHSYVGKFIPANSKTSVTIVLEGGVERKEYSMEDQSSDNPVVFRATIMLLL